MVKGESQYGGTRLFAEEAAAALARAGHRADRLDIVGETPVDQALAAAARERRYDAVISINILGDFRSPDGLTLAELFGCPHVLWHTDYVLASWPRLLGTPPSTQLLVVDPTQVQALDAAGGPGRFNARFFPHAAVGAPAPDEPDVETFRAARPIAALWSGGFAEPQRPWASAPPQTRQVLDGAVELALSVEWMAPHEALAQALLAIGMDLSDPAWRRNVPTAWLIDTEVRTRRRLAFLSALAESGVELHICGHGWEPQLHRFKNATCHGPVDMTRMIALMRQSRVVLNTNGNFGAGSHERPFSAALAGAASFSDFSRFYAMEFRPDEDIALFFWLNLKGAMDQLRALLADPRRCWHMASGAKQATLARHTWDRRIVDILQAAGLIPAALHGS